MIGGDVLPGLSGLSWHQSEAHCTVGLWLDPSVPSAHWYSAKTKSVRWTAIHYKWTEIHIKIGLFTEVFAHLKKHAYL